MHGAGNDYVYVNTFAYPLKHPEDVSRLWSDRHKGIGGDGLILIGPSDVGDFSMHIYNNDGSEARMCGNGTRCVAKYVFDKGLTTKRDIRLETLSGIKVLHITDLDAEGHVERVTVDMDAPALAVPTQMATADGSLCDGEVTSTTGETFRGTFVSMGNPHFVIFTEGVEQLDINKIGPTLEFATAFPERCNIEFAEVRTDGSIRMRVWERGSGITMACGTGACATAVAAALTHRRGRESDIVMDGGTLHIEWREADNHVYMTGPAATVFEGKITLEED